MNMYRYTDNDLTCIGYEQILQNLEDCTKDEIIRITSDWIVQCLFFIKDCESPIERLLGVALYDVEGYWSQLLDGHLNIYPQMDIVVDDKTYRADFQINAVIDGKEKIAVIECDGHEFHEKTKQQATKDRQRERALTKAGYIVIRFIGSEIYNNTYKCIKEIREILIGK